MTFYWHFTLHEFHLDCSRHFMGVQCDIMTYEDDVVPLWYLSCRTWKFNTSDTVDVVSS